jgi:hypothetical protein
MGSSDDDHPATRRLHLLPASFDEPGSSRLGVGPPPRATKGTVLNSQDTLFDPPLPSPPSDHPWEMDQQQRDLLSTIAGLIDDWGWDLIHHYITYLQPGRIVGSSPARWTDPETSHLAAKREQDVGRFSDKSRQAKLLRQFASGAMTDQQAAIRVVGAHAAISAFDGCRRRCSDLRAAGYLFDSGRRRHNTGSSDESIMWVISASGLAALDALDENGWSR